MRHSSLSLSLSLSLPLCLPLSLSVSPSLSLTLTYRCVDHVLEASAACQLRHVIGIKIYGIEGVHQVGISLAVRAQLLGVVQHMRGVVHFRDRARKFFTNEREGNFRSPLHLREMERD